MKSKGGLGREVRERSLSHLSPSLAFIFSRSFLLGTAPHYLNAWNRLSRRWSPSTPLRGQKSVIGSLTYSYPSWFFSRYLGWPQTWIMIFALSFLFYTNRSWLNWNQLPLCSGGGPTNDKSDETCVGQGRTQTLPDDATSLLSCTGWWIQGIRRFTWDTIRWALVSPLLFRGRWSPSPAMGNRPPLRPSPPPPPHPPLVPFVYSFTKHSWVLISKIQGNTSYSREHVILSCSEHYNYTDSCRKIGYGFLNTPRSQGFFPPYGKSRGSEDVKCPVLE